MKTTRQRGGEQVLLVTYKLGVGANNVLGAWNDSCDCYHYDLYLEGEYAGSQTWTVQQVDRPGQPLRYGDRLRLINKGKGLALAHDWRPFYGELGDDLRTVERLLDNRAR